MPGSRGLGAGLVAHGLSRAEVDGVELGAGVSFLKEMRAVEEWRAAGKRGGAGGQGGGVEAPAK